MPSAAEIAYLLVHPVQLRAIIQWKVWHNPVHERDESKECDTLKKCFYFLDKTSRSFAAVIKELHPELLVPVTLFYLILRGLDTIEDDMTIPLETKDPILRGFDKILEKDGWTFTGNHVKEKDRQLLVEFDNVITEYKKIKPEYQAIIADITKRMGDGMAHYCAIAEQLEEGVNTVEEYEEYCHYVAGLVGEGCTKLFVEAKLANPVLLERPELMETMGQFLQQTNIIRDIKEDYDDKRRFWPKEIWSKYVDNFDDLLKPENEAIALNCSSEMIVNALNRTDECLFYLAGLREQSVFNFCAIPQSMAISTLAACYRNPDLFKKNVKITKGEACQNMLDSTGNLQMVAELFRRYLRLIHKKATPKDPNFLQLSVVSGKTEQFIEKLFPSQVAGKAKGSQAQQTAQQGQEDKASTQELLGVAAAVLFAMVVCSGLMIWVAWMAGARFDLMWEELWKGNLRPAAPAFQSIESTLDHSEL